MSDFERALTAVLTVEGDYSDDAHDPGGKTRFGITEAVARANGYTGEMRQLPREVADAIYRKDYWAPCHCDALPWPLSLYVFDAAVNQGVQPAIKMLQRALDTVQDGVFGPTTLRLAGAATPWHAARYMAFRVLRYTGTRNADKYLAGWMTRLFLIGAAR